MYKMETIMVCPYLGLLWGLNALEQSLTVMNARLVFAIIAFIIILSQRRFQNSWTTESNP